MAKITKVTTTLAKPSEKKHVVRYDSSDDDAALSSVYVSNAAIASLGNPKKIKVTIEAA